MNSKELIVVGIGSSAGGLEALQIVLAKISNVDNCAFIIAQHLSPTHKSMMTELLSRITKIPVIEIKNGMKISKMQIKRYKMLIFFMKFTTLWIENLMKKVSEI